MVVVWIMVGGTVCKWMKMYFKNAFKVLCAVSHASKYIIISIYIYKIKGYYLKIKMH
jgi:hypothetical protein